jgi:hypothetical protein
MTVDPDEELARAIQHAQSQLSELFYESKVNNDAIKHIAIYTSDGQLLAHSPDDEGVVPRLLQAQYRWLGQIIGPAAAAIRATREAHRRHSRRQVTADFGRPSLLRIQTDGANLVDQIYGTPIDEDSRTFLAITSRATTRRNAYVVNEPLLLEDLENLAQEIRRKIFPEGETASGG